MQTHIETIFAHMDGLSSVRKKFLAHIFVLFISIPGRVTFLNMARYGTYTEKTYRTHFEADFDFFEFNRLVIEQTCSPTVFSRLIAVFSRKVAPRPPIVGNFGMGASRKPCPAWKSAKLP